MNEHHLQNRMVRAEQLTDRQREVYTVITQYYSATGEPCPVRLLARRFGRNYSTIRDHLDALQRKGWIRPGGVPHQIDG